MNQMMYFELFLDNAVLKSNLWLRYVNELDNFLIYMNSRHLKIQFTRERKKRQLTVPGSTNTQIKNLLTFINKYIIKYRNAKSNHPPSEIQAVRDTQDHYFLQILERRHRNKTA